MTDAQRKHVVEICEMLYAHRLHFGYPPGDQRTARDGYTWHLSESGMLVALTHGDAVQMDCSETSSWIWRCVGVHGMSQSDYTGTLLQKFPIHYLDGSKARPGAGVVFGGGTGHHMGIVIKSDPKGGDPTIYSHGAPGGKILRVSQEAAAQKAMGHPGVRYLNVSHA